MTLDDIGLYTTSQDSHESQRPLHAQARCVCSLVRRYMPRHKNDDAWKINVYVQREPIVKPLAISNGIASVTLMRATEAFFVLDDRGKKQFVLDALLEGTKILAESLGWPIDEFVGAFVKAQQDDLVNEWKFQPKWNRSRKLRAYVRCVHELQNFRAWMCVEDRAGNKVAEQYLLEEVPEEFCFMPSLGKVSWTGKSSVSLFDRSGRRVAEDLRLE